MTHADKFIGKVISNRYKITSLLGKGGMGAVYQCTDIDTDLEVAIKFLRPVFGDSTNAEQRFLREAKIAKTMVCPQIAQVYDYGRSEDDILYYTMELVNGTTLHEYIYNNPNPSDTFVLEFISQLSIALKRMHEAGIIHRDLKPANIMITSEKPTLKVLDLGLAKSISESSESLSKSGVIMGTPQYLAPETLKGLPQNEQSDIYAMGIVTYEMILGARVFKDQDTAALFSKKLEFKLPDLPMTAGHNLTVVAKKLAAGRPERRYATCDDILRDLRSISTGRKLSPDSVSILSPSPENSLTQLTAFSKPKYGFLLAMLAMMAFAMTATFVISTSEAEEAAETTEAAELPTTKQKLQTIPKPAAAATAGDRIADTILEIELESTIPVEVIELHESAPKKKKKRKRRKRRKPAKPKAPTFIR